MKVWLDTHIHSEDCQFVNSYEFRPVSGGLIEDLLQALDVTAMLLILKAPFERSHVLCYAHLARTEVYEDRSLIPRACTQAHSRALTAHTCTHMHSCIHAHATFCC